MPSTKTLEKTIKKAAKSVLVDRGIDVGNRRGNKELDFISRKIASVSSGDLQDAEEKGQKLGEKISELSEQRGKKNLDRGVVRQVALEGEFFPIAKSNRKAALPTTVKSDPLATSTTEPDREPVPAEDPTAPTQPEAEISVSEETVPVTETTRQAEPAEDATAPTEPEAEISVSEETVPVTETTATAEPEAEPEPAEEESEVRSTEGEPSQSEDSESQTELPEILGLKPRPFRATLL